MSRALRFVAWANLLACPLVLLLGGLFVAALPATPNPQSMLNLPNAGPTFFVITLVYLLPGILGGLGTLAGRHWGPIMLAMAAVFLLAWVPVGSVLGALSLWVLVPAVRQAYLWKVERNRYQAQGQPPPARAWWEPAAPLAAVAPPTPPVGQWGRALPSATCDHLRPIEAAMRQRGISLRPAPGRCVEADCTIDLLALGRQFGPHPLDDLPGSPSRALLRCTACDAGISVLKPGPWVPGLVIFPGLAA